MERGGRVCFLSRFSVSHQQKLEPQSLPKTARVARPWYSQKGFSSKRAATFSAVQVEKKMVEARKNFRARGKLFLKSKLIGD